METLIFMWCPAQLVLGGLGNANIQFNETFLLVTKWLLMSSYVYALESLVLQQQQQ